MEIKQNKLLYKKNVGESLVTFAHTEYEVT